MIHDSPKCWLHPSQIASSLSPSRHVESTVSLFYSISTTSLETDARLELHSRRAVLAEWFWWKQKGKNLWKGWTGPLSRAEELMSGPWRSTASPACFHGHAARPCLLAFPQYFTLRWNIHEPLLVNASSYFSIKRTEKINKQKNNARALKELFGTVLDAVPLLLFRSRICFIDNEGAKKK